MFTTQYHTPQSGTFASLALKLPARPSTLAPARLLAVAAFGHLAPGIKPTASDIDSILRLIDDMTWNILDHHWNTEHPISYRFKEDDGLPMIQFYLAKAGTEIVLADAWVEFVNSPDAFFYWES